MSKILYLIRHAEAESPAGGTADFSRHLTAQGLIDAARMSRELEQRGVQPDFWLCSPAERTRNTFRAFSLHFTPDEAQTRFEQSLYDGGPAAYLSAIHSLPDAVSTVLVIGHNPSITQVAEFLTHHDLGTVPTAGVVGVELQGQSWADAAEHSGKVIFYDSPEKIGGYNFDSPTEN